MARTESRPAGTHPWQERRQITDDSAAHAPVHQSRCHRIASRRPGERAFWTHPTERPRDGTPHAQGADAHSRPTAQFSCARHRHGNWWCCGTKNAWILWLTRVRRWV